MVWSAAQYLKFEDERTRPARDLLAQVPDLPEGTLYDLGCGPGNSTELVKARFTDQPVIGIDSDGNMLEAARKRLPDIPFRSGDLARWQPDAPASLFYANAVFQWLPDHPDILDRLMTALLPGGALAVQMPDNLEEPTHRLMDDLTRDERFARFYEGRSLRRKPIPAPSAYIDRLSPQASRVDVWHTVYYHRLEDAQAIVEWVKGTGLRPYLDALPEDERPAFLAAYREGIAKAYPPMTDGRVLLRFPRLFLVAVKSS